MKHSERLQLMKEKAESVQAVVSNIKKFDEAFQYAIDLTLKQGGKVLAAPGLRDEHQIALWRKCESQGLQLLAPPLRPRMNEIHTAITPANWGIAETGTLVLDSAEEDMRIATMLAETHVAILPASGIRTEAAELENDLKSLQQSPPRYIAFITGPSRTADIERILTIGVHGPQELHILIMEDN